MQQIRFDDVAALQARVGEPYSPWGPEVTITQDMINRFADVTIDHQWIHIDVERAQKESPLKCTIAHGFFVLSLLPHLRQRVDMQVVGYRNVLNYGADKLRFQSPVPPVALSMPAAASCPLKPSPKARCSAKRSKLPSSVKIDRR